MAAFAQFLLIFSLRFLVARIEAQERYAAESRLLHTLLSAYDKNTSPRLQNGHPVNVSLEVSLIDVVKADQLTNQVDLVLWVMFSWTDPRLVWDPTAYNDMEPLRVRPDHLWMPDVVVYGQTEPAVNIYPDAHSAMLYNNGHLMYISSRKYRVFCELSGLDTDEGAECRLKFGSWTHNGDTIDLFYPTRGMDLRDFFQSKYEILNTTTTRNVNFFACCPEPYPDITYSLTMTTKRQVKSSGSSFLGLF